MALAYICHARNDLGDHLLQVLDLKPNSSQPGVLLTGTATTGIQSGQTGYLTYGPQNDTVVLTATGGGAFDTNADYFGLAVYLIDNVNSSPANVALTAAQTNGIAVRILARVAAGSDLTLADINVAIRAEGGVGAGSTLNGAGATRSTGSVTSVLRVLSGEAYLVAGGTEVIAAGGGFPGGAAHVPAGAFTTLGDAHHRQVRRFLNGSSLARSILGGALSKCLDAGYLWINPTFTYGAAGTAETVGGVHIGVTGAAKALTVYSATGTALD